MNEDTAVILLLLTGGGLAVDPVSTAGLVVVVSGLWTVVHTHNQAFWEFLIRKTRATNFSEEDGFVQHAILVRMQEFELARLLRANFWAHSTTTPEDRADRPTPDWRGVVFGEAICGAGVVITALLSSEAPILLFIAALSPIAGGLLVALIDIGRYLYIGHRTSRSDLVDFGRDLNTGLSTRNQ